MGMSIVMGGMSQVKPGCRTMVGPERLVAFGAVDRRAGSGMVPWQGTPHRTVRPALRDGIAARDSGLARKKPG